MTTERTPQAKRMADESMVRKLAAQAGCIWPTRGIGRRTYVLMTALALKDLPCRLRDPERYAVWQVPVISGRKPRSPRRA